ncbi:ABC transporter substrate-binding protein [Castellaniella ginsengisoli]|uniref:ABC transporter substrate-binding protein n=1 Tax=Castellaniella ginsengisoli TaxID=546114 RepID=A0AB39ERC5_9BURK
MKASAPSSPFRRRLLRAALSTGFLGGAAPLVARAAGRRRILMITYRGRTEVEDGFLEYLRGQGKNPDIVHRDVGQDIRRLPAILDEIPGLAPDLIYTWGTTVTLGVAGTWRDPDPSGHVGDTPVVFALVSAPVSAGIVPALTQQGRNITGAVHVVPTETQVKAMAAYRGFDRVGLLYSTTEPNSRAIAAEMDALCAATHRTAIHRHFVLDDAGRPTAEGVERLIAELREEGAEWFYLVPDTFLGTLYDRVIPASIEQQLPTFGATELSVRKFSALTGLVSRYRSVGRLAAVQAEAILYQGVPASQIPIETLKRFALLVNLHTAKALGGFYPPIEMLNYADVITQAPVPTEHIG